MNVRIEQLPDQFSAGDSALLTALVATGSDFAWFGGQGSQWTIIPLALSEENWDDVCAGSWAKEGLPHNLPFTGGTAGIIPYEAFSPFSDGPAPLLFKAGGALLREKNTGRLLVTASGGTGLGEVRSHAMRLLAAAEQAKYAPPPSTALVPCGTDDGYEKLVNLALEDIRNGRFYQINLLRYFAAPGLSDRDLAVLLGTRGGPYSSWLRQGSQDVVSFSPEHFVGVRWSDAGWTVTTSPIKGTAARSENPDHDARAARDLLTSRKDRAELHMIIDLMRNDLNQICEPASVIVRESAALHSFVNVHHLIGCVDGMLRRNLNVKEFLHAVCPAGSITGAPKIEVMHAVREYEGRQRGFFMGNAFLLDSGGRFDSSVLIRTMSGSQGKNYEFSAGSGIVMSSDPRSERLEIGAKCNVLSPEGQSRWQ